MTKNYNKPPFKPLTMKEVNDKKGTNGYNVVSTFTGAGGSCLGLKLAGFNILYAVEFIEEAQKTYALNHQEVYLDKRDIREIKGEDILRQCNLNKGEVDLLEGSPPCSGFSNAGKGSAGWNCIKKYSDTEQRVDDLFFEFTRLANELQPKMILCENVPALATGKNRGYLKLIIQEFQKAGYEVQLKILEAVRLNVPQIRKRLIFIGKRKDLDINIEFPAPLNYTYTVEDAIPNYRENKKPNSLYRDVQKGTDLYLTLRIAQKYGYKSLDKSYLKLNRKPRGFTKSVVYADVPSPTLMQTANFFYGYAPRYLSIFEAKRIQTFADDFQLTGNYFKQFERIGRSVPPRMYEAVGLKIKESLDDYYGEAR